MNRLEQIKQDLYVHGEDLEKVLWLDDVKWLVERVEMLEKVVMTSDKCHKWLLEQVTNSNDLIRDIEEEYRVLHEKYKEALK